MRLIFMGTPDFAVPCLESILKAGHEVARRFPQDRRVDLVAEGDGQSEGIAPVPPRDRRENECCRVESVPGLIHRSVWVLRLTGSDLASLAEDLLYQGNALKYQRVAVRVLVDPLLFDLL